MMMMTVTAFFRIVIKLTCLVKAQRGIHIFSRGDIGALAGFF